MVVCVCVCVWAGTVDTGKGGGLAEFALAPIPVSLSNQLCLQVVFSILLLSLPNYFCYSAEKLWVSAEFHDSR